MAYLLRGYRHSGLVMYISTLPAPSASAPCISAILTHLRMRVKICILTHPPAALPQYGCPLVLSSTCLAWALGCKNKHFSENKCFYHHNQREKRDVVKKNSRNLKFFLHGSCFWRGGGWKKEMLRKKTHVVRKKTHVVRKLFYVASIFGGAAGRKNRPPWKLSSTAWELSSTAGDFLPTALPLTFHCVPSNPLPQVSRLSLMQMPWSTHGVEKSGHAVEHAGVGAKCACRLSWMQPVPCAVAT